MYHTCGEVAASSSKYVRSGRKFNLHVWLRLVFWSLSEICPFGPVHVWNTSVAPPEISEPVNNCGCIRPLAPFLPRNPTAEKASAKRLWLWQLV